MGEFGDFEEVKEEGQQEQPPQEEQPQFSMRARFPRQGQLIGIVLERLGGKRMSIKATDKKVRNCRVPGRFGRKFWLRPGNFVIIEPWPDDNEKGDIVYQYRPNEIIQLKKKGMIDNLERDF
jgi:translation initiation factor 1A